MTEIINQTNELKPAIPTYLQVPDYLNKYPSILEYFSPRIEISNSRISIYLGSQSLRLGDLVVRTSSANLIAAAGHSTTVITSGLNFIWGQDTALQVKNTQSATKIEAGHDFDIEKNKHKEFLELELNKCDYLCLSNIAGCNAFLQALEEIMCQRIEQRLKNPKILTNFLAGSHTTNSENELQLPIGQLSIFAKRFLSQTINRVTGTEEYLKSNPQIAVPVFEQDLEFNKLRARSYFDIQPGDRIIAIGDVANGGNYGYRKDLSLDRNIAITKELIKFGFRVAFLDPTTNFDLSTITRYFTADEQKNIIFSYSNLQPVFFDGQSYTQSTFLSNIDILSVCTDYLGVDTGCSHFSSSIIQRAGNEPQIVQLWSNAKDNQNRGIYDNTTGAYKPEEWLIYNSASLVGSGEDLNSIDTIPDQAILSQFIPEYE